MPEIWTDAGNNKGKKEEVEPERERGGGRGISNPPSLADAKGEMPNEEGGDKGGDKEENREGDRTREIE